MEPRIIAIGDIHGCSAALSAILEAIAPKPVDTLVFLGDYVDRGPDTRGVLETLIGLRDRCHVMTLMGNHEEMMLGARKGGRSDVEFWLNFGGREAMNSYGPDAKITDIPREHFRFLESLLPCYETDTHFFAHANYAPNLPLDGQSNNDLLWRSLDQVPRPHYSGKTVILGHTPQRNGQILDRDYLKCLDTGCGHGGLLSAFDVEAGDLWQVLETGGTVHHQKRPVRRRADINQASHGHRL